jgi:hypothetical protein
MSVSPTPTFPPPPEDAGGSANVRPQPQTFPPSGNNSPNSVKAPQSNANSADGPAGDEVRLQWNAKEQIPVYQFVNQQGSLILQVPSEQLINLAGEIAEELQQESAPGAAAVEGAKNNGS